MFLLECAVHEKDRFARLGRALLQSLFEEIPRTFNLGAALEITCQMNQVFDYWSMTNMSLDEFGEIDVPNFERDWEREELDSTFIYL